MICCWNRTEQHRVKYGCLCIPWKLTAYVSSVMAFAVQLALALIFVSYQVYYAVIPLALTIIFHLFVFYGLMKRRSWMMRVYFVFSFLYSLTVIGVFIWLLYVLITADNNPWYTQCLLSDMDYDCKKVARIDAAWICAILVVTFIVNIMARYILVKYQNYIQWKSRQPNAPLTGLQPGSGPNIVESPAIHNAEDRQHVLPSAPPVSPMRQESSNMPHWYPGSHNHSFKTGGDTNLQGSSYGMYGANMGNSSIYPNLPSNSIPSAPPPYKFD